MNDILRKTMWFLMGLFAVLVCVALYIWASVSVQDKQLRKVREEMAAKRARQDSVLQIIIRNQDSIKRELRKMEERK